MIILNGFTLDFPGGRVDRNSFANAADTCSTPDPGRFHRVPEHRSSWTTITELVFSSWRPAETTEAHAPRACPPQQEKPPHREAPAPQRRVAPLTTTRESPRASMKTQRNQVNK